MWLSQTFRAGRAAGGAALGPLGGPRRMAAAAGRGGAAPGARAPDRGRVRAPARARGARGAARAGGGPARPGAAGAAALQGLEWGRVSAQVAAFCETAAAADWVAGGGGLVAAESLGAAEALLDDTDDALAVLRAARGAEGAEAAGARQPLIAGRVPDVRPLLRKCRGGRALSAKQLDGLARALEGARALEAQLRGASVRGLGAGLALGGELEPLLELLRSAVAPGASALRDDASSELKRVRAARRAVCAALEAELVVEGRRLAAEGALEGEPRVLYMQGRACLPVRRGRQGLAGSGKRILGESNSGGTFYVEPAAAAAANDEALLLKAREEEEEAVLLQELSDSCGAAEPEVQRLLLAVGRLDAAFARARHALWIGGSRPTFSGPPRGQAEAGGEDAEALAVDIEGLRHPVLVEAADPGALPPRVAPTTAKDWEAGFSEPSRAARGTPTAGALDPRAGAGPPGGGRGPPVGVNFKVAAGTRGVAVTGPNTGGKTAALKALGLAALMARAGLHLPSVRPARLPFFDSVLADIGDGQSLEQNLSTFSGHIRSIRAIISEAGPHSLVLLDEVGSGTDPAEGAALGAAILERLAGASGLVVCTTHHSEVKELAAEDPRFVGAAAEFDAATLRPTYRLLWGESGESSALDIAGRLGFSRNVVEAARATLLERADGGGAGTGQLGVVRDVEAQLGDSERQLAAAREGVARERERLEGLRARLAEAEAGRAVAVAKLNEEAWAAAQAAEARIAEAVEGAAGGGLSVAAAEREVQAVVSQAEALARAAERRASAAAPAGPEGEAEAEAAAAAAGGRGGGAAAGRLRAGEPVRIRRFGGAVCTVVAPLRGGGALVRTGTGLEISVPPSELLD